MTGIPLSALPLTRAPQGPSDTAKLHKAAQAFEAIFVRQILSTAHAANFGNDLFSSQGMDTFKAMQDERFAEVVSQSGALGFAKIIEAQLAKRGALSAKPPENGPPENGPPENASDASGPNASGGA